METRAPPKVSALMGAYNYGQYIAEAIESAMEQDYPPGRLELVIVDDGSSDDTADVVDRYLTRYPGRIKFVRQANAGATAATNRARREADGDLIALLDADDVWLPEKTRRQVEMMQRRPELGLTWTRMRLVNGTGATLHNNYGYIGPVPENGFARVIWENVAVQSSLIIEADLFDQIPEEIPYADWWLALVASQHKKIDYIPEDLVLYRWHGANITGGVGGVKALREAQKGIHFQRWVMRNFELSVTEKLSPSDMSFVWTGFENQAQKGLTGLQSHFGVLATVDDQDRADAADDAAAAQLALEEGDFQSGCALLLRARACDPYDAELRHRFDEAVAEAEAAAKLPDPLDGNRGFAVLADAAFLFEDDSRLTAYADAMRAVHTATLVIDASRMDSAAAAERLGALVKRCGLADDEEIAMIGLVGKLQRSQRFKVKRATRALYAATAPTGDPEAGIATFTPDSLSQLRELAERYERQRLTP